MHAPPLRLSPVVAGLLTLVLAACGATVGETGSTSARGVGSTTSAVGPSAWASERDEAVRGLFAGLSAAAADGRLEAWARSVGADDAVDWPRTMTSMAELGVDSVRLVDLTEVAPPPVTSPSARTTWQVRAVIEHRIGAVDTSARPSQVRLTLTGRPGRAEDVRVAAWEAVGRPQPWDLGPVQVRRAEGVVVAVTAGAAGVVDPDELLRRCVEAQSAVEQVWGTSTPVVVVAGSSDEVGRMLGRDPTAGNGVSAVTDGPITQGEPAGADRVVVDASAWAGLNATGRDVVLRHEITHVATRRSTYAPVPLWFSEGFADHVAYRDVPQGEREVARSLLEQVRGRGVPPHLPDDGQFTADGRDLSPTYAQAWLAVRVLVEEAGEQAVVSAYRRASAPAAGESAPGAAERTEIALREVLGTGIPDLEVAWRERLRALAEPGSGT